MNRCVEREEKTPSEEPYDPADDPDADPEQLKPIAERPSQAEGEDEDPQGDPPATG